MTITVRADEAVIVRQLVERYLAGESLRSLTVWLEGEGITTVSGGVWRSSTLRSLLASGRIAGLREHRGQVVGSAVWAPIISTEQRDRVLARMAAAATTGRRTPRGYLLSGLGRCGKCEGKLFSSRRQNSRRYVCQSGPDHGGCGRLTVVAEPLEQFVTEQVLYRLDTPLWRTLWRGGQPRMTKPRPCRSSWPRIGSSWTSSRRWPGSG